MTYDGIVALILPIVPLLIFLELFLGFAYKKPQTKVYKVIFLIYLFNRIVGRFIAIGMVAFCIGFLQPYSILETSITWYWFIYSYIVWEFAHFIYHFLAHKVRLFWCLHATHHSPEEMNLSVAHAHFFLEAPYADFIRTSICILMGVNPVMLFTIMFIDGTYGALFDAGVPNFVLPSRMIANGRVQSKKLTSFSFFGPTCDSLDYMLSLIHI